MIKIVVDTEEELNIVRRVLRTEACSHNTCSPVARIDHSLCTECVENYCNDKVELYKIETVEMPKMIVV